MRCILLLTQKLKCKEVLQNGQGAVQCNDNTKFVNPDTEVTVGFQEQCCQVSLA